MNLSHRRTPGSRRKVLPTPPDQPRLAKSVENTRWTPVRFVEKRNSRPYWLMRCACGTEKTIYYPDYLSGRSLSCGCYLRDLQATGSLVVNRLAPGESSRNQLLLIYKRGAAKHGRAFELTADEFLMLTSGNCHYCGHSPHQVLDRAKYTGKGNGAYIYNGIDRVNPQVGYVTDNCVSCCRMCNYAKSDMPQSEFIAWLDGVANFRSAKRNI